MKTVYLFLECGGGQAFSKDFTVAVKSQKHASKVQIRESYSDNLITQYEIAFPINAEVYIGVQEYTEHISTDIADVTIKQYQNGKAIEVFNYCDYIETNSDIRELCTAKESYKQFFADKIILA